MIFKLAEWTPPIISLSFIFLFLPISLFIFYKVKPHAREITLIGISLAFLLFVVPQQVILIVPAILINYFLCLFISHTSNEKAALRRMLLTLSIFINLLWWVFAASIGNFQGYPYLLGGVVMPFLLTDTNLSVYRKQIDMPEIETYILFALFFPRLFVGPFCSIRQFVKNDFYSVSFSPSLKDGFIKFVAGAVQFSLLGVRLMQTALELSLIDGAFVTKFSSWWMVVALVLGIYHMLFGLATAAQGLGMLYGIQIETGWSYPFGEKSLKGFVRNFNGSLEDFFWRTAGIWSLQGRWATLLQSIIVIAIGAMVGLWLNFSLGFMAFGILLAVAVVFEVFVLSRVLPKWPNWARQIYTITIVLLCFTYLAFTLSVSGSAFAKSLFSLNVDTINNRTLYYINDTFTLVVCGMIFSSKLYYKLMSFIKQKSARMFYFVRTVLSAVLFILLVAIII